jgi:hypothetical protein
MKRALIIIFFLIILIGVLGAILEARSRAPSWLREKIITELTKNCPQCKAGLDSVEVNFLDGTLTLHDFEFIDTPEHTTQVAVKAHFIGIEFDRKAYLNGLILVRHVKAEGVDFTLIEKPAIKTANDDSPPLSGLPPMVIQGVEVSESSFRYVHKLVPKESSLLLTEIHGSLGSWVTRPSLVEQYAPDRTSMTAWGVLEHSGTFEVKAEIDPLSQKGTLQLDVVVQNQSLPAVGPFFVRESGMDLEGLVVKVSTYLDMKNGKIDGNLRAAYTGLKIKIVDRKNSGVKNFLETIGAKITIAREQGVNGKPIGQKNFHDERGNDQSLFSAMFHALGGAAKELVK